MGQIIDPAQIVENEDEDVIELWPDNWKVMRSFLLLETQWRKTVSIAGFFYDGLDYTAAAAALKGRSHSSWRNLLAQLKIMEMEALPILNERSDK